MTPKDVANSRTRLHRLRIHHKYVAFLIEKELEKLERIQDGKHIKTRQRANTNRV